MVKPVLLVAVPHPDGGASLFEKKKEGGPCDPPYSVLARRMGPGGAGAPRGARDVTNPNPVASEAAAGGS